VSVPPEAQTVAERLPELDGVDPADAAESFRDLPGLVLLDSSRAGVRGRWSYLTADPLEVIDAASLGADPLAGAREMLARMAGRNTAARADAGPPFAGGLCGYLGYDFGRRLEGRLAPARANPPVPELRLALHDWVVAWNRATGEAWLDGRPVDGDSARLASRLRDVRDRVARPGPVPSSALPVLEFRSETSREEWAAAVESVRAAIAAGELYQANIARRLAAPFGEDPWPRFRALRAGEPAPFSAYLDLGGMRAILSASPEAFLSISRDGAVATHPIKGTRQRGMTAAQDRAFARELVASAKDRAENTMIVDVLRNDLGRVCRPGTVRVPRLLRLERTATVQHLVSTVTGVLAPGRDAFDLLAAAFPGASITGAPKIRAMELIDELEPAVRGPYSGAVAWIGADGAMGSSILIRSFVADGRQITLHVGGGITWRSDPTAEWDETVAKARGPLRAIGGVVAGDG
jgi:para-aminobenzoate synthetase component 1